MIKDINTYIDTVNKSVASSVSGAQETKVDALRQATLKASKVLPLLPTVTLTGKITSIPFIHLPDDDDTTFRVGGIDVTKELLATKAKLVDETVEDASPNLEAALDKIVTSQVRLKLENYIADAMTKVASVSGVASAKNFSTIVDLLKKFPRQTLAIEGQFVAVVSPITYFTFLATMDNAHKEMVKEGIVKLVPMNGLDNDALVVFHTQGIAIGYNIYSLEKDREAGSQYTNLVAQLTVGFGYDSDYIKNVKLTA